MLRDLLQWDPHASIPGERYAGLARRRSRRAHSLSPNLGRTASPIWSDLIYDRHRELNRPQPLIDIKMLTGRQFGTCFLIMLVTGALLIATTQILPQLLQEEFGYTATLAGLAISPGGAVTMVAMVLVGRLGFVQPRYLIAIGAAISCYAMVDLFRINPDADFWYFAWSRIYLGIGLPLIFIPITTASYDGIAPDKTDQASALINLARNFGGSMGVALSQTVLARREQFHQSRLVEHIGSWNPFYNDTLSRIQGYLNGRAATGSSSGTSM
jgi:MFS transporter, DHA2 family, multidrug resistance protein